MADLVNEFNDYRSKMKRSNSGAKKFNAQPFFQPRYACLCRRSN
jgi:hypothetical protein